MVEEPLTLEWYAVARSARVAVHTVSGRRVEVVTAAAEAPGQAAWAQRVEAAASLDHPRVPRVRAEGVLDGEAAVWLGAVEGAGYALVDEVEAVEAPRGWADVRGAVEAALDVLAHAHARGVVLGGLPAGWWARGAAGWMVRSPLALAGAGSGCDRGVDLRALGRWALAWGCAGAQAAWAERLATGGFGFAADAALGLRALPGEVTAAHTLPSGDDTGWAAGLDGRGWPPLPATGVERSIERVPLTDARGSLVALRPVRTAGRSTERRWMWSALASVVGGQGLRAVVIEGAAGMGKSHLAGWLARRAHALGLAQTLRAEHTPGGGSSMGLGPMLLRHVGCAPGEVEGRRARVAARLGDDAGLWAVLDPSGGEGREPVVFDRPDERYAALAAALGRVADERPLVVHLEDVQWGEDALRFALYLLRRRPRLPALLVLTARLDTMANGATVAWRRLLKAERVDPIRLGPLSPSDQAEQVASLIDAAPALVDRLVERTAGSPLLAEETLRLWLGAGALDMSPVGAVLQGTAAPPEGMEGVWLSRVDDALRDAEPQALEAVELAAVLGVEWDEAAWTATCSAAGVALPRRGLLRLHTARLLRRESGTRWRFVHRALVDAVLERARRAGRAQAWHRHAATAVAAQPGYDPLALAVLQAGGGLHAAAAETLVEAFEGASLRADLAAARQALVLRAQMLDAMDAPIDSAPWVQNRVLRARMARRLGRMDVALRSSRRAEPQARALGDARLHAEALIELGTAARLVEDERAGQASLAEAVRRAAEAGEPAIVARAKVALASCLNLLGRFGEAEGELAEALAAAEAAGDLRTQGDALVGLADIARRRGALDTTESSMRAAYERYRQAGHRAGRAVVASLSGDLARYRGDLETAEAHYTESRALYAATDSVDLPTAEANLALVEIARGRLSAARSRLERALRGAWGGHELRVIIHALLLPCMAGLGDWAGWDRHMAAVGPLMTGGLAEPDAGAAALDAAERADAAGEHARAADARRLALAQYETLGQTAQAEALRRALGDAR